MGRHAAGYWLGACLYPRWLQSVSLDVHNLEEEKATKEYLVSHYGRLPSQAKGTGIILFNSPEKT